MASPFRTRKNPTTAKKIEQEKEANAVNPASPEINDDVTELCDEAEKLINEITKHKEGKIDRKVELRREIAEFKNSQNQ